MPLGAGTNQGVQVDAPAAPARRTGLLSVATVRESLPGHAAVGGVDWEPDLYGTVRTATDLGSTSSKTFDETTGLHGPSFYVYASVLMGSFDPDDAMRRAETRLLGLETVGVETRVLTDVLVAGATKVNTTAVPVSDGIALLEEVVGATYGGLPMLYMDISMTSKCLAAYDNLLVPMLDGKVETGVGTRVAVGAGLTAGSGVTVDGTTAGASEFWVFASGEPVLHRGPVVTTEAFNHTTNQRYALAERIYVAQVDAPLAAALVTEPA